MQTNFKRETPLLGQIVHLFLCLHLFGISRHTICLLWFVKKRNNSKKYSTILSKLIFLNEKKAKFKINSSFILWTSLNTNSVLPIC